VIEMQSEKSADAERDGAEALDSGFQERYVGHHLIELYDAYVRFLRGQTQSKLMNLNLTQWRTLTFIRFNADRTQRALSTAVGIDPSSMTPIVDFFESKGWVRRHQSKTNRSAYGLRMTPAGLKAYRVVEKEIGQTEKIFVQTLGATESNRFSASLQRLHERLERKPQPERPARRSART
jgi:DNA-binding MarR family transcriptional regulator